MFDLKLVEIVSENVRTASTCSSVSVAAAARVLCGRTLPAADRDRSPLRQPAFCVAAPCPQRTETADRVLCGRTFILMSSLVVNLVTVCFQLVLSGLTATREHIMSLWSGLLKN